MPKHGFLTPKAIANRIKAKGLQKLRWYCQMCQKQCRDENGFKCHTMSESHQRQLLLFAENPHKYIDEFSQEFLDGFMELLRRRFGTRRVHANQVYQEYIADRNHLHMNATEWETLTDFVKWLGRAGHCTVDETEKGWFVAYIDRDPDTIQRQQTLAKQEKLKLDDEERMAKFFQRQMEKDLEKSKPAAEAVYTELKKENEDEKVVFSLKSVEKNKKTGLEVKQNPLLAPKLGTETQKKNKDIPKDEKKRKSALDEIKEMEEELRAKKNKKDYWATPDIVVKIISKKFGDEYYKRKAVVKKVEGVYKVIVKLIDSGEKLSVEEKDLETVIPNIGRKLLILKGNFRGSEAELLEVNFEKFCVRVKITSGIYSGKVIDALKYEDVSKLHTKS